MSFFSTYVKECLIKLKNHRYTYILDETVSLLYSFLVHTCLDCFIFPATLSSCSGRIIVYRSGSSTAGKAEKRGTKWILVSHAPVEADAVWSAVKKEEETGEGGSIDFKFEPFILHLQCRTIELAKRAHTASLESGFRNTGLTVGKAGKLVLAVRSTHGLELPLSDGHGRILVSETYVEAVVAAANAKFAENEKRHRSLEEKFIQQFDL